MPERYTNTLDETISCPAEAFRQLLLSVTVNLTLNPVVEEAAFVRVRLDVEPPGSSRLRDEVLILGATLFTVRTVSVA
jgi:hypothetical protein